MITICSRCQGELEKPKIRTGKRNTCLKCQKEMDSERYYKNK